MKCLRNLRKDCVKLGTYRLTPDAKEDLWRIYQWGVRTHGVDKADEYFAAFFECFEMLASQPLLYPAVEHVRHGYRQCPCGVDTIYYRIVGDDIEIMSILGQQDRNEWLR